MSISKFSVFSSVFEFCGFCPIRIDTVSQCLKIDQKVAYGVASEASYVYIFSGQKFIENAKNGQFGDFLKN